MARMIPDWGLSLSSVSPAEQDLYWRFKRFLSDDFTIIHSLPWLSGVVSQLDPNNRPTGELDFLVLHPNLGILALEVKGGYLSFEKTTFVRKSTGERIDPVAQVRRSIHALASWIATNTKVKYKLGYGIMVPDSHVHGKPLPPSLLDAGTHKFDTCIDHSDLKESQLEHRIRTLMSYWKEVTNNSPLTQEQIDRITNALCPIADYHIPWVTRIADDTDKWLCLTPEQTQCLREIEVHKRIIIEGRSGTGKTLIARTIAQDLDSQGLKVLFLVFNRPLADKILSDLENTKIRVWTFHQLCHNIAKRQSIASDPTQDWFKNKAPKILHKAITENNIFTFDALIIDEAQVFHTEWLQDLNIWFKNKRILICCDETQVFAYENKTSLPDMLNIFDLKAPYLLTINVRSPRAVFERTRQVLPTSYQKISLREQHDDTLIELIVPNPLDTLYETLYELREENIDVNDIVIIQIGFRGQPLELDIEGFTPKIININKYRGLESPIVIVWADDINDTLLSCAYSRSTSKCIAIYSFSDFTSTNISTGKFKNILTKESIMLRESLENFWIHHQNYPIITLTAFIPWSKRWNGLVISAINNNDTISLRLWGYFLKRFPNWAVFSILFRRKKVIRYSRQFNLKDSIITVNNFSWCYHCNQWTQHDEKTLDCYECSKIVPERLLPPLIDEIKKFDKQITEFRHFSSEIQCPFQLPLMVLAYWRTLDTKSQSVLLPFITNAYLDPVDELKYIALLLTGITIMRSSEQEIISLYEEREKYQRWNIDILNQIEIIQWHKLIALSLHTWIRNKFIRKIKKGMYTKCLNKITNTK